MATDPPQAPADFSPLIEVWRGRLVHRVTVAEVSDGRYVEYALDIAVRFRGRDSAEQLRQLVWQALEYMRLGRYDLVRKHRRDRHVGRPPAKPPAVDDETLRELLTPAAPV